MAPTVPGARGREPQHRPGNTRAALQPHRAALDLPEVQGPHRRIAEYPVISYLILRGRCAGCGAPISPRYPLIEALTGVLSGLVAWKFGYGAPALAALVLTWFLIALTFIDVDTQLLPELHDIAAGVAGIGDQRLAAGG